MAESGRSGSCSSLERDVEQAMTALKKGAHLLKYGRKGKPRFCPFRLSNSHGSVFWSLGSTGMRFHEITEHFRMLLCDWGIRCTKEDEKTLIWFYGKEELQLDLHLVSKIVPGQRTANFQRNPCPEKEYQSFSLIYGQDDQSLDMICKDKDQAELWFVGLKALISRCHLTKARIDIRTDVSFSSDGHSPLGHVRRNFNESLDNYRMQSAYGSPPRSLLKSFSSAALYSVDSRKSYPDSSVPSGDSLHSDEGSDVFNTQEGFRVSLSSVMSSSSQGSGHDVCDTMGDVYMWGEGIGSGILGGGSYRVSSTNGAKVDSLLPKQLESAVVLDVQSIACGSKHAALINRQGEVFCWGEESGGHGVDMDVSHPQIVESLANTHTEFVACGEYHTCAVSSSGEVYMWGGGKKSININHWTPRRVPLPENTRIASVACGPWHTALVTYAGKLLTFGDGTFGALGHGDKKCSSIPREVDSLKGLKTIRVACGVWHTAAVVEVTGSIACTSGKLFTWGDGDKGQLGHGVKDQILVPSCVAALVDFDFRQVACGHILTVALTTSGQVYTMGSSVYGQLGNPQSSGHIPSQVEGKLREAFVEEVCCGAYHVAVLTSKAEVYTWGKGANGRLGHGDALDRNTPTLVEALKDKQAKTIACGLSNTAAICSHKWFSCADQSVCSGCRMPFGFTRKRHNCYNCGYVFCHACSSKKAAKATLAPSRKKLYRVCGPCFLKLKMTAEIRPERSDTKTLKAQSTSIKLLPSDQSICINQSKQQRKLESLHRVSPAPSETRLWNDSNAPSFFDPGCSTLKIPLSPMPVSTAKSGSVVISTLSRHPSPPRSMTPAALSGYACQDIGFEELLKKNTTPPQEVLNLQVQVDALKRKCLLQEFQLQKAAMEMEEVKELATEEARKCKAAKEVIKSLTVQLKDMADKLPPRMHSYNGIEAAALSPRLDVANGAHAISSDALGAPEVEGVRFNDWKCVMSPNIRIVRDSDSNAGKPYGLNMLHRVLAQQVNRMEDSQSTAISENVVDNENHGVTLPLDHANHPMDTEWVEQDEPGVYITFVVLSSGVKDLRRVRFSRKKFNSRQAEQWWEENRTRVYEQYSLRGAPVSSKTGM